jgi:hypothetical protein
LLSIIANPPGRTTWVQPTRGLGGGVLRCWPACYRRPPIAGSASARDTTPASQAELIRGVIPSLVNYHRAHP